MYFSTKVTQYLSMGETSEENIFPLSADIIGHSILFLPVSEIR